jgi:hypothetical protein
VENGPVAQKLLVLKDFSVLLIIVFIIVRARHTLVVPCNSVKAFREFKSGHGDFLSLVNKFTLSETQGFVNLILKSFDNN